MLLTKEVKVKWNGRNKKHYESLGYVYTKMGDEFVVVVEHLPSRSHHTKVEVRCDYCGKIMLRSWLNYIEGHDNRRREFIIDNGYKVLDINSGHSFPTIEQIERSVNTLTTTNINYISIDLDI